jgi:hypothetical protein
MTAAPEEADAARFERAGSVRLSINLSPETVEAFRELTGRKGLSITEGIRRAIVVWQFMEEEISKGNQISVVERNGQTRTIVLL